MTGDLSPTELAQLLAELAEDLSIEVLSEFTKEDYPHIAPTVAKLEKVSLHLRRMQMDTPFPVLEVLRIYRSSMN